MAQRCCLLHLTEQSCLLNFFKNSNFKDSGISLLVFPSRTNPELHNISVTPKTVKKVKTSFDSSERSGLDCIPVVVLKNCESELSYILAELFNMCLKESCFQIVGRSHWCSLYLYLIELPRLLTGLVLLEM